MTLSNLNATPEAKQLYALLCSARGKFILSGQQESNITPDFGDEFRYLEEVTGMQPAIRGFDFINDDFSDSVHRAKCWAKRGGIVSFCWHWGAPPDGFGYEDSQKTIDINEVFIHNSPIRKAVLAQLERAAAALGALQRKNIPVLWRPFHEFDGEWFWWGKGGPDNFIRLWQMMHDLFTRVYHLDNLIWVLGYSDKIKEGWYPGDSFVDVIGADNYKSGTNIALYKRLVELHGTLKPIAFHECGTIPDPIALRADGANWAWFLTWHTIHLKEQNKPTHLKRVYQDPYVKTLAELPKINTKQ